MNFRKIFGRLKLLKSVNNEAEGEEVVEHDILMEEANGELVEVDGNDS